MNLDDRIVLKGPPYKGEGGHWLTRALFVDLPVVNGGQEKFYPVFSLYKPVEGFIDAHQTFLDFKDPTGVLWAERYLGSVEHWNRLCEASWFDLELSQWRRELDQMLTAEAIQKVIEIAKGDGAQALSAAKYLAEQGWVKTRGRPSKAEMSAELKKATKKMEEHEEDMARIGLKVIKGGKH
jgi:hypothetical protein